MEPTSTTIYTRSLVRSAIVNCLFAAIAVFAAGFAFPATATASRYGCVSQLSNWSFTREVRQYSIDQELFNTAVLFYVNVERCNQGLVNLQPDARLMRAALQHSSHMSTNVYVSHKSRQVGFRNLQDRLAKANVKYGVAGENVAQSFLYAFNKQNVSSNQENCSFNFVNNGSRVPRHTYDTLAKDLVALWMASPIHRNNILHRSYRRAGATFGINSAQGFCGTIYAVQNFSN